MLQDYLAHAQPLLQPLLLRGSSQPLALLRCSSHLTVACSALLLQQRSLPGRQPLLLRGKDAQVVVGRAHQQAAGVGAKAQRVHALHGTRGGEMSGGQQVCVLPCMLEWRRPTAVAYSLSTACTSTEWRRHTECRTQDATKPTAHLLGHIAELLDHRPVLLNAIHACVCTSHGAGRHAVRQCDCSLGIRCAIRLRHAQAVPVNASPASA